MNGLPLSAQRQDLLVRLATCAGLLGIVIWDSHTPMGVGHGLWYVLVVALAQFQSSQVFTWRLTVAALAGILLGLALSPPPPPGFPLAYVFANFLGSCVTLLALYLGYRHQVGIFRRERQERESLSLRQQEFEALAESLPVQIWTATSAGEVDYVGRKIEAFSGRPRAELVADWLSFIHPDDRVGTQACWQHAITTGEPYEVEFRLRRADGSYVWHLTQAIPERDSDGAIVRWLGSSLDIDYLRALRAEAQELAQQLRNNFESITDAFFTLDSAFRFTYVNAKAAAVLGRPRDTLLGQCLWECCAGGEVDPFVGHCRRAMTEQHVVHAQEWFASQALWLDIRIYPSSSGLTIYFLDMTAQREAQRELLLLRTAVSRLNDIIMITEAEPLDAPGPRTIFINEAFERITGYTEAEVIGRDPRFLQGPETQRSELDRIRHALENFQPVRAQLINYTKERKPFWLELDIVPIADEGGRYTHFVSVERDITERKQMARQLQLAQRMEAVGHLTGGIAHDFNNLLTVVLGNADMLVEELERNPELVPLARMIVQAADRGASLVRSLLAFARRQSLSPEPVAIDALVRELVPILETSLTRQHRLELEIHSPLWTAMIDPGQLESALLNLVINARDAMQGNGRLTLAVENATLDEAYAREHADVVPGQYVMVAVTDTGGGIPAEHLDRLFEPFFSTKEAGRGNGLGLSSVFGFVKQSGGHITVASEPGKGATFRLYLPRTTRAVKERPAAGELDAVRAAGRMVLIVEDEDGIRRLAAQYLEQAGYRTQTSASGEEAILLLEQGCMPDLLFTDVVMPGSLSGPSLARAVRARHPGLPVLFVSGFAEETRLLEGDLEEGTAVLDKPYRRDQLLAQVAALLGRASL